MANDRKTLSLRMEVDGVETVRRSLEDLGTAGAASAKKITDAFARVGIGPGLIAKFNAFRAGLSKVVAEAQRFGRSWLGVTTAMANFGRSLTSVGRNLLVFKGIVAATALSVGLLGKRFGENAENITNQASALGLTTDAYQRLQAAARDTGIEQTKFENILAKFTVGAENAGDEAEGAAGGVDKLGKSLETVAVKGADGAETFITIRRGAQEAGKAVAGFNGVTLKGIDGLKQYAANLLKAGTTQEQLAQVVKDFGTRGAADTLSFLRNLAFQFDDTARAAAGLIDPLTKAEIAIGLDLDTAIDNLSTNLLTLRDRLSAVFGPVLTDVIVTITKAIRDNEKALVAWAREVATGAAQVFKDFLALLRGADDEVQNRWMIDMRDGLVALGKGVSSFVSDIFIPAFKTLRSVAEGVSKTLNSIFGTNLSGDGLLVIAIVLQLSGAFTVLSSALVLATAAFRFLSVGVGLVLTALRPLAFALGFLGAAIASVLGIPVAVGVAIAAALAAAAVAIYVFWDEIVAAADFAWDAIKKGASAAFAFVKDTFGEAVSIPVALATGDFAGAFENIKAEGLQVIGELKTGLARDVESINALLALIGVDGPAIWRGFATAGVSAWNAVKASGATALETLRNETSLAVAAINARWVAISDGLAAVWETITASSAPVWASISSGANAAFANVTSAAQSSFSVLRQLFAGDFASAWDAIRAASDRAWQAVTDGAASAVPAVISALATIGPATQQVWDAVTAGAATTWEAVRLGAAALPAALAPAFEAVAIAASAIWFGLTAAAQAVWTGAGGVVEIVTNAAVAVGAAVGSVAQAALEAWTGASASVAQSARAITDAISRATEVAGNVAGAEALAAALVQPFVTAQNTITQIFAALGQAASATAQAVAAPFAAVGPHIDQSFAGVAGSILGRLGEIAAALPALFAGIGESIARPFLAAANAIGDSWASAMRGIVNQTADMVRSVGSLISSLVSRLNSLRSAIASASSAARSSSGSSGRFASGGPVWGAGTGTSDSIPARLSNGEFVLKARAVKKWGLDFLYALNGLRLPVMNFADGGFVNNMAASFSIPRMAPSLAAGGGGSSTPMTLVIDGQSFTGLSGNTDAVAQLRRHAAMRAVSSAGRKPNWYGG